MLNFLGEYELKVDTKNRILLPAALKKQLGDVSRFVINRSFDRCLNLYPYQIWEGVDAKLAQLNPFVKKERDFVRYVRGGASEVNLDGQGRINLPKRLMDYAKISNDMILLGNGASLEMWDLATYEEMLSIEPEDFSLLAEEVMVPVKEEIDHSSYNDEDNIVVPILRR